MEIIVWILAGGLLGWIGCAYLGVNTQRGVPISAAIGAFGALIGGKAIAPMFTAGSVPASGFSADALLFAAGAAAVCLLLGDQLLRRFDL